MTKKTLKKEYQPGGEKRYVILDKAVQYLKDPKFGLQSVTAGANAAFNFSKLAARFTLPGWQAIR